MPELPRFRPSLRARVLALVLLVGLLPLLFIGVWLTASTARSGEALLRQRLDQTLDEAVREVASNWVTRRSLLLDLADGEPVRTALRSPDGGDGPNGADAAGSISLHLLGPQRGVHEVRLRDPSGALRLVAEAEDPGFEPVLLPINLPVHDGPLGGRLGTLEADLTPALLVGSITPSVAGMALGAFDEAGFPVLPTPFDPSLLQDERFVLGGDEWITARRNLTEPALVIVAAAPLTPFTEPFRESARTGALVLLAVAGLGLALAFVLTTRLTHSLERLSAAADAVASGELDGRVPPEGPPEVARLADAFNTMTESLRVTLAKLADRQALAAVGEFAASLAHEIRNPLTSIRIDLQVVEEHLEDPRVREVQARALAEIQRLDATVAGALQGSRAGRLQGGPVRLDGPLGAAAQAAAPELRRAGATLTIHDRDEVVVQGDASALEQVFLNLILNAAQAVDDGGAVTVEVEARDGRTVVTVADDGRGIADDALERVFEPLYTTRTGGTGLGLSIARRLVEAHGGSIAVESGRPGTRVTVTLPLSAGEAS